MMWIVKDTDLQFHQALENRCILHSSSIQYSQYSLINPNSWMYPTYVSQKTAPFLRMEANSFFLRFSWFPLCTSYVLAYTSLLSSALLQEGPPHHFSPNWSPLQDPQHLWSQLSHTAPVTPAVLVGTWRWCLFRFLSWNRLSGRCLFFCFFTLPMVLIKMAFNRYLLNKYSFNKPNILANDIWNKPSHSCVTLPFIKEVLYWF